MAIGNSTYLYIYSNDGNTQLAFYQTMSNVVVTETGLTDIYEYSGDKSFVGFAISANATEAKYVSGDTITLGLIGDTLDLYIVEGEAEPTTTITYNGNVIASLEAGQTATLPCKDKKMIGDIVVTVPAESGESGGVKKYSITYGDLSGVNGEILAQPTEICEGQTVYFVYTAGNSVASLAFIVTNCEYEGNSYTGYYHDTQNCWPTVVALSNPTGDVTVTIIPGGGGVN